MTAKNLIIPALSSIDFHRFWYKVRRANPQECWLWKAGTFDSGYGAFQILGKSYRAHRVAYFMVLNAFRHH